MSKKPTTGKLRLEIENGYANVYDEHGITSLNDILLGWTDTTTGAYASPAEEAAFLEELVRRWNAHTEDTSSGPQPQAEDDEPQRRGQLTARILRASERLLGYAINQRELRLMPYIMSVMMNDQKISPDKINQEEREILSKWREAGHIEGGAGGLGITEEFWGILCEIVRLGYVDLRG